MANERPPIDLDSAGVYFMTVEEFEGRAPAKPAGAFADLEDGASSSGEEGEDVEAGQA